MDMQQMPMGNEHNTFWRDDKVTILFRSDLPLIIDGILNKEPLRKLDLPAQRQKLNTFLRDKGIPVTLHFLGDGDHSDPDQPPPQNMLDRSGLVDGLELPPGVYPFGFPSPIESQYGLIRTSVVGFFHIEKGSSQAGSGNASMEMPGSSDDHNDNGDSHSPGDLIPEIVTTFNESLKELNEERNIPVTITTPTWLTGGTPGGAGQGCPLDPPLPVSDSCSNWHIELPDLSSDLQSVTGDGVTVFVLDSFPEQGVIARAARDAGDDNLLLRKVNETVTFDYSFMSGIQDVQEIGDTQGTFVGKDVYGRHYPILLADHGLFSAGIVRDLAPDACIECVRVLDDLCVGDVQLIANVLQRIYFRKALQSGDLYGKPVVVNMSLVIPTDEEANSEGIMTSIGGFNNVWASLKHSIQCLSAQGVIIAAAAGNEADPREFPGINRANALYPAKFANSPDSIDGVIPVGAVDSNGKPASYSCYPGSRGVATYGGEVPTVDPPSPPNPPSTNVDVKISDAPRGIYSSVEYPPLLADPPQQYYAAPNDHAWAYWVGTSFATPIISALAARVLELAQRGGVATGIRDAILNAATGTTHWDQLKPSTAGNPSVTVPGKMLKAVQCCVDEDRDADDEDKVQVNIQVAEIKVTVNKLKA